MQITLEEDINVADVKPDIDALITRQAHLELTQIKAETDHAILRGTLSFTLLYSSQDDIRPVHSMQGQIPFEETVNMEQLAAGEDVFCHYELEDFQIHLINSRKISVRAIVSFQCQVEEDAKSPAGIDILSDEAARAGMEQSVIPEGLHKRFTTLTYTQSAPRQKDIFRIKEELTLPKGKPCMDTLLYYELTPQNLQTRLLEDGIRITGDLHIFFLYVPIDQERRMEYFETELPIDGIVNCAGCHENMIPDIRFITQNKQLEIKADEDGENRLLDLELLLSLNMKFYEEKEMSILDDAYSTACQLTLTKEPVTYEQLVMKSQGVIRTSDRIKLEDHQEKFLQICTASGRVQIDEQEITSEGIALEGVVELDVLYITENDERPFASIKGILPFSHLLEITDISPDDHYQLQSDISQISVIMLDAGEMEAKVVLSVSAAVFTPVSHSVITRIEEAPLDLELLQSMPGIVGFIAEENTSLWDLAKEYCTSPESIMELNGLTSDEIHPGDRLLLAKQVDGL